MFHLKWKIVIYLIGWYHWFLKDCMVNGCDQTVEIRRKLNQNIDMY